jgi:predicted nucleotidyltransferase
MVEKSRGSHMMTRDEIIRTLATLKPELKEEGVTLLGIFGSYARGDQKGSSDIDLLYTIDDPKAFVQKYGGFGAFSRLEEIREMLAEKLGKKVDLVAKRGLNSTTERYVLKDLMYV